VIDWPDACRGDPAADACRSYLLLKLNAEEIAEPYLDAWCRVTDVVRGKVTDWLPHIAAGRLAENVPGRVRPLTGNRPIMTGYLSGSGPVSQETRVQRVPL
jgi:hypothetical protein